MQIGAVRRLVLFAGPSGSGKTSFLKSPDSYLSAAGVPDTLGILRAENPRHVALMSLSFGGGQVLSDLVVHVDLSVGLRRIENHPTTTEELLETLEPSLFANWPRLQKVIARSQTIDVVTLFVRREQHFQRWSRRTLAIENKRGVNKFVVALNADPANSSELHRRFYRAWHDWVVSIEPNSLSVLDGTYDPYRFADIDDFLAELDTGYRY